MPRNFACRVFETWLEMHVDRFRYPPIITQRRRDGLEMRFAGVSSLLKCFICRTGDMGIYVEYQGVVWDMLAEFDLCERRTSVGAYFCELCREPKPYPSRKALWIGHSFEPLLEWANTKLRESQTLALYRWDGGSTYAELAGVVAHQTGLRVELVHCCSVVIGTGMLGAS